MTDLSLKRISATLINRFTSKRICCHPYPHSISPVACCPPHSDKIQKNSYFFRETFPKRTLGANNFISSNILCKIFEPLNHHACNSIPNILGSSILNPFRCLKMSNGEFYDFWQLKKSNGDRTKVLKNEQRRILQFGGI